MLKVIKRFRSLQSLFITLWISLPALWNVGALLLLIMFMCASFIHEWGPESLMAFARIHSNLKS
jgi:hypothetical protein